MPIHLELVTPERVLFREEVDEVTLPTREGEITVLPNHIPLIASLVAGVARLKRGKETEDVAVSGGFIEIQAGGRVRVLADTAERGHELDLSVIEKAKQRAEAVMKETTRTDDNAYAAAAAALERELARYKVVRKHRGSTRTPLVDAANLPHDENPT
jgi:F-type H+-transporting ATPase subunit epsilon